MTKNLLTIKGAQKPLFVIFNKVHYEYGWKDRHYQE